MSIVTKKQVETFFKITNILEQLDFQIVDFDPRHPIMELEGGKGGPFKKWLTIAEVTELINGTLRHHAKRGGV